MELNTILELVKAGFTRDEIMQMAQPQTPVTDPAPPVEPTPTPAPPAEPIPAPVNAQVAPPVPQPAPQPAPAPQPVQTPAPDQPTMAQVMESIAKLTSAVQANAIAQSVIPQGISNPPSAEDMLAEIIRPTFHQRGE